MKRWRKGSRMMFWIRSRSTERAVFVAGSRYCPEPGPDWTLRSSGGCGAPASLGCVGSHSTKRSPISDCGRIVQKASLRKSWYALLSMFRTTAAFLSSVRSIDRDAADDDAADAHVHPGDHERGVVEDRADLVAAAVAARAGREDDERDAREQDRGDGDQPLHGPGGTIAGSQSRLSTGVAPRRAAVGRRLRCAARAARDGGRVRRHAGHALGGRHRGQQVRALVVAEGVEERRRCARSARWRRSWRCSGRSRGTSR